MKNFAIIWALAAVILSGSACERIDDGDPQDNPYKELNLSSKSARLASAGNGFAFEFINRVNASEDKDFFISPLSMQFLLGMILNGARGETADEICKVIAAIGNHDEATAQPLNRMCSALIIADKTDVRRSRVRSSDEITFDIHDRVNYAVTESSLKFNEDKTALVLDLTIDNEISSVMEYFEIFMNRMLLCRRSAERLGVSFRMTVNGSVVI